MEPDEVVLSDVHLYEQLEQHSVAKVGEYALCITRFPFSFQDEDDPDPVTVRGQEEFDEDGDQILPRKARNKTDVIIIEHAMATKLSDVGLQVWSGALLLCDFIIHNGSLFSGCQAVELGSGVGLTAITLATVAKSVIATDIGKDVLTLCSANAERNRSLYRYDEKHLDYQCVIKVKELNWLEENLQKDTFSPFKWKEQDVKCLENSTYIFGADVIYDDKLTAGFFNTIHRIMQNPPAKVCYIALEKRLNFTLQDLDIACPAYTHFEECLNNISTKAQTSKLMKYRTEKVEINFPQYFQYQRTKYLELWKISSIFVT